MKCVQIWNIYKVESTRFVDGLMGKEGFKNDSYM